MFDLIYVPRKLIQANLLNLVAGIAFLVLHCALLFLRQSFTADQMVLRLTIGLSFFELGSFLGILSFALLYENTKRQRDGRETLGLNRFGSWKGNSFVLNQLINGLWLIVATAVCLMGMGIIAESLMKPI